MQEGDEIKKTTPTQPFFHCSHTRLALALHLLLLLLLLEAPRHGGVLLLVVLLLEMHLPLPRVVRRLEDDGRLKRPVADRQGALHVRAPPRP